MWNEKFELPDRSYSVSDIQGYFESIIKKHETVTGNPPIRIYVNKIEKSIIFRIKLLQKEHFKQQLKQLVI